MRIGILGGTFNPVHTAHLVAAETVREEAALDHIVFIPCAIPPHKAEPSAAAPHRLAMLELAARGNPRFLVDDREIRRPGPSYSIDTLRELSAAGPADHFYFILGMDAFAEIRAWKEAAALFSLASFVIIPRPRHPLVDPRPFLPPGVLASDLSPRRFGLPDGHEILLIPVPQLEISASEIRRRVAAGRSVRYILPAEVESYLREHQLYATQKEDAV